MKIEREDDYDHLFEVDHELRFTSYLYLIHLSLFLLFTSLHFSLFTSLSSFLSLHASLHVSLINSLGAWPPSPRRHGQRRKKEESERGVRKRRRGGKEDHERRDVSKRHHLSHVLPTHPCPRSSTRLYLVNPALLERQQLILPPPSPVGAAPPLSPSPGRQLSLLSPGCPLPRPL